MDQIQQHPSRPTRAARGAAASQQPEESVAQPHRGGGVNITTVDGRRRLRR